jgi:hypothetical protein
MLAFVRREYTRGVERPRNLVRYGSVMTSSYRSIDC